MKTNLNLSLNLNLILSLGMCLTVSIILSGCSGEKKQAKAEKDPYMWLEDIEGEKALDWARGQNKISEEAFSHQPLYDTLKKRFLDVFNDKDRIIYPDIVGSNVYNLWQDEKNERGVWRRMSKADFLNNKSDWEVVLDLDELSVAENRRWVFQGAEWLLPDYRYCLMMLSDGGKDEKVIREFDAVSKTFVSDGFKVNESKCSASWVDKDNIIVATDFGAGTMTASGYPTIARIWTRETNIDDAPKVIEIDTTYMGLFNLSLNDGTKHYNFILVYKTFFDTELYYLTGNGVQRINYPSDAELSGMYRNEIMLALQSDWVNDSHTYKAGSLVSLNLDDILNGVTTVKPVFTPGDRSSFVSMLAAKDFIVINTMDNVVNRLTSYRIEDGKWIDDSIEAPDFGSIFLVASDDRSDDYFFQYSNLISPPTLYCGDNNGIRVVRKLKDVFDAKDLVIEQNEALSKDGTHVPYFIVHKSEMAADGKNPTLIYAYGGFNVAEQPAYSSIDGIGWIEQGGVYVIANIRGGGEFGPSWHKAAMKEKRQNAYDDFFAVTEDLINKKITSHDYLGAYGWSNGGLMAGVVFTQRPDLYNAVVVGAPLLDMKRYSKMLAGASWVGEYGDPDIPEEWAYIKKYSPYHNVIKNKAYPQVLFITSTKDDRVHPGHARKMAAKMIDMGHPVYYHETIEGGHGAASTNAQRAEMEATIYTYLNMKLNHK